MSFCCKTDVTVGNSTHDRLAEKLGFVGTVRGRLLVSFSNRAGSVRPVTVVTDRFTAVL
jgi:hypothetical protein